MSNFILSIIIIQIIVFGYLYLKNPLNFMTLVVILNCIFIEIPGYIWINKSEDLKYAFQTFEFLDRNLNFDYYILSKIIVINIFIYIGGFLGEKIAKKIKKKSRDINISKNYEKKNIVILIFYIGYIVFIYYISKESLKNFILPIRKPIFQNEILKQLFLNIPWVMYFFSEKLKKNKKINFFWFISGFMSGFITAQRRTSINFILFVVLLKLIKRDYLKINEKKKIIISIIGMASLVPILWWIRTFTSAILKNNSDQKIDFFRRGFFEIIFGGQATAFPTIILVDKYIEKNITFLYSFKYLLTVFIPRYFLENYKYVHPDHLLEREFNLIYNPSIFYIGELFFNFKYGFIFFSILMSFLISFIFFYNLNKNRDISIVMFANVLTLFKNGFSIYIFSILFYLFLRLIIILFLNGINKKKNRRKNVRNRD